MILKKSDYEDDERSLGDSIVAKNKTTEALNYWVILLILLIYRLNCWKRIMTLGV